MARTQRRSQMAPAPLPREVFGAAGLSERKGHHSYGAPLVIPFFLACLSGIRDCDEKT